MMEVVRLKLAQLLPFLDPDFSREFAPFERGVYAYGG
jgi:hypothetical protein